ncbi:hypothetical protein BCR44DRAFT_164818 [Catenaria anguillulae PL171]|uniref:Uncharacterized protein n=1 Tax=Catenaria anguillulae PL171 TaxID=765915 RepID=A0A1Y2HJD1_9FUNG|nr:hypothetical protein BCR44DRAFT_164818 [Catenaria anguillulae PL171]
MVALGLNAALAAGILDTGMVASMACVALASASSAGLSCSLTSGSVTWVELAVAENKPRTDANQVNDKNSVVIISARWRNVSSVRQNKRKRQGTRDGGTGCPMYDCRPVLSSDDYLVDVE